jgi:endonuclease-3 related protein
MKHRLLRLYSALHARYGPQGWWPARTPFEVAVGAVLTQHTAWPGAARAIANLRSARRLEPRRLAALPAPALGRLIRPAGTWRLKARRLLALTSFPAEAGGRKA